MAGKTSGWSYRAVKMAAVLLMSVAIALLAATATAQDARAQDDGPQTWYVEDVVLDDDSTVEGTFVFDAPTVTFSDIDLRVRNLDGTVRATFAHGEDSDARNINVYDRPADQDRSDGYLLLLRVASDPLTNAGGTIDLDLANLLVCVFPDCSSVFGEATGSSGTLTTVPLNAPTIISPSTVTIPENSPIAVDVESEDIGESEGSGLTYRISGGLDEDQFRIDTQTGELRFARVADFENPRDDDANNVYDVEVTVTDSADLTATQQITITVTDVDDITTWFLDGVRFASGAIATGSFDYDAAANRYADVSIQVTEADGVTEGVLYLNVYSFSDANFIFSADGDEDGQRLSGADNILLEFAEPLTTAGGTIAITPDSWLGICDGGPCFDNTSEDRLAAGEVTTTPTPPTLVIPNPIEVTENTAAVIDLNATDNADSEGSGLTYSLDETNGDDTALFQIDAMTGELSFTEPPNFDAPLDRNRNNEYLVGVVVTDSLGAQANLTATVAVTDLKSWYLDGVRFASGATAGGTFEYDPATEQYSDLRIAVDDANGAQVAFYQGQAHPFSGPSFMFVADGEDELHGKQNLRLAFVAPLTNDGGTTALGSSSWLGICEGDECLGNSSRDNLATGQVTTEPSPPTLVIPDPIEVAENSTAAVDIDAIDNIDTEGAGLSYFLSGSAFDLFSIDRLTGVITFDTAPDFENPLDRDNDNRYELTVTVFDSTRISSIQSLTVIVTDVDDTRTWYLDGVRFASGATATGSFDRDAESNRHFNVNIDIQLGDGTVIEHRQDPSGFLARFNNSSRLFLVDALPDADLNDKDELSFSFDDPLTNDGGTSVLGGGDIAICDDDVCDDVRAVDPLVSGEVTTQRQAPTITSPTTVEVAENTTAVIDLDTTDNIDSESAGLQYSLSGADAGLFSIDPTMGVIEFAAAPDFEDPQDTNADNRYELVVSVGDSSLLVSKQPLTVTVTDVAEIVPDGPFVSHGRPSWDSSSDGVGLAMNEAGESVLIAVKADGNLYTRRITAAGPASWEKLGAGGWAAADIAIDDSGRVEIVAVKDDGRLFTRAWLPNGDFGSWTKHGAPTWDANTQPAITTDGSTIGFAAVKEDGRLYTRTRTTSSGWEAYQLHGAPNWAQADLAVADGELWLAGIKADGRLYTRQHNGSWGSWTKHGAPNWSPTTAPSIATAGRDVIYAAVKADGRLYTRQHNGSRWGSFTQHGRGNWANAAVAINDAGSAALIATKDAGQLYTRTSSPSWGSWTSHGRATWSADAKPAVTINSSTAHFLATKTSGHLYTRTFS